MDTNLFLTMLMAVICITAIVYAMLMYLKMIPYKSSSTPLASLTNHIQYYNIAVIVLFLFAIFLRVYQFGMVPGGVNQDEALAAVDANALAQYGTDRFGMLMPVHFTGWGYGQMSVLLSYLMVPFIKIFGLSVITARLPILIVSLLAVYVFYKFSDKLFGKIPALIALAFIAIDPWQMMQSRWAIDCNMLPHFFLFSSYFLYLGLTKKKYLYLSMIFFAFTMYTYGIAWYSVPILLFILCIYLIVSKRLKIFETLKCLGVYLVFAWPIFGVMIINFFKLKTLVFGFITVPYFANTTRANDLLFFADDIKNQFFTNLSALNDAAFLQNNNMAWNSILQYGALYLFTMPFVILGFGLIIKKFIKPDETDDKNVKAGAFIFIAWLFVSLLSGIIIKEVNINRINIIFYPMCMFIVLGIYFSIQKTWSIKVPAVLLLVTFSIAATMFSMNYFGQNSKIIEPIFFKGFETAIQNAEKTDADVVYVTNYTQYDNAYHVSEVLTLFYDKIDPLYFQGKKIIERSGKQLLPYSMRYKYIILPQPVVPESNSVYVFNEIEKDKFNSKDFEIIMSENYGVAIPK